LNAGDRVYSAQLARTVARTTNTSETNRGEQVALFGGFHDARNCGANLIKNWNKAGENDLIRESQQFSVEFPHGWHGKDK
jgi:hypothetical protein